MNPVLYISVELKVRDLDPRLVVTAEALRRGLHVIIGQQWALSKNIFNVPTGAFLFKTVNEIQATHMADAKEAGHVVAASDEEVLACASDVCFQTGMGQTAPQLLDRFYAQSERHARIVIDQFPNLAENIVTTGNPRIDLLSSWGRQTFAAKTQQIRDQYGPYILFNTNFGWVNSIWNASEDTKQILIRTGRLKLDDPKSVATYEATVNWEKANMEELEKTISWAADHITNRTIVIRPHPAENPSYWSSRFSSRDNVVVVTDTSHVPWTLGADLLVHTSCSTGTEAAVLGVPALSVTPCPDSHQQNYLLSNSVNALATTWRKAAEAIATFFDHKNGPIESASNHIDQLTSAYGGLGQGQAASLIADDIRLCIERRGGKASSDYSWSPLNDQSWVKVDRRPEWVQKFSLDSQEMAVRLKDMGNLVGLNRLISIEKIDDSLFHVFPG